MLFTLICVVGRITEAHELNVLINTDIEGNIFEED